MKSYSHPGERFVEWGGLRSLSSILLKLHVNYPLIVTGKHAMKENGVLDTLIEELSEKKQNPSVYDKIQPNPTDESIQELISFMDNSSTDGIIGLGGGSALDCAKAAALLFNNRASPVQSHLRGEGEITHSALPCVAVPTTSGTGSEVTPYVSFTEKTSNQKFTFDHPFLIPRIALLDPELTVTMPPYVTACTGFDALGHAMEAYWSINHSPFSDTHALRAARLIMLNLAGAVKEPTDYQYRLNMSIASCEAGLAIARTRTTAAHAASYSITTQFSVPHGHAVALTLAEFFEFNESSMEAPRSNELADALGGSTVKDASNRVRILMDECVLQRKLQKLDIPSDAIEMLVSSGFRPDRVKNNPRKVTEQDLREIFLKIY